MSNIGKKLKTVLEGYAKFLRDRDLAPPKHQPHLVRWVREFLLFAEKYGSYTFEQTLDLFLAAVGERVGIQPWQVQQAADAVRIYRYQYRVPARMGNQGQSLVVRPWKMMRVYYRVYAK